MCFPSNRSSNDFFFKPIVNNTSIKYFIKLELGKITKINPVKYINNYSERSFVLVSIFNDA